MDRDIWLAFYGVGLALAIQVLYNGINEYPNMSRGFWLGLIIECFILVGLFFGKGKNRVTKEEQKKEKEKREEGTEEPIKLETTDYEPLSALLDFNSDRAVAHASFLVACVFGLFALLSLMSRTNPWFKGFYSIAYWFVWFAGYYSLVNFNKFATRADKTRHVIRQNNKSLLDKIEGKDKKPEGIDHFMWLPYYQINEKWRKHKVRLMLISYFVIVGIIPWLLTLLQ